VGSLVRLEMAALRVDLSAVGKVAAVNPLLVLARRAVGRVPRGRRRPLAPVAAAAALVGQRDESGVRFTNV
jgi:hypothetical protein